MTMLYDSSDEKLKLTFNRQWIWTAGITLPIPMPSGRVSMLHCSYIKLTLNRHWTPGYLVGCLCCMIIQI
jgi:hypothetical protein